MSRYIDADILKDKTTRVNNIWNGTTNAEGKGLDEIIDDIPTADVRENVKWISCDERLPKNSEKVLIVVEEAGDLYCELGSYECNQWWWLSESGTNYWEMIDDVLAWLPIPRYGSDMRGEA